MIAMSHTTQATKTTVTLSHSKVIKEFSSEVNNMMLITHKLAEKEGINVMDR